MAKLSSTELQNILAAKNPWHLPKPSWPAEANTVSRPLADLLWRELSSTPLEQRSGHTVITGPRRSGKTTVLYQTAKRLVEEEGLEPLKVVFLSLEEAAFVGTRLDQILDMLVPITQVTPEDPAILLLDEICESEGWDRTLKISYDDPARYPFRIVASSSSAIQLNRGKIESGAGRWKQVHLMGCMFREALSISGVSLPSHRLERSDASLRGILESAESDYRSPPENLQAIRDFATTGGFPENLFKPHMSEGDKANWIHSRHNDMREIAMKATEMDIPKVMPVRIPGGLSAVLRRASSAPCGEIAPINWEKDIDMMDKQTLERYLSGLEEAMLLFRLENYANPPARNKKAFFYDNAIPASQRYDTRISLTSGTGSGWPLENMAASALQELVLLSLGHSKLHHLRDGKLEADLVFLEASHENDKPVVFEIASSSDHDTSGLFKLMSKPGFAWMKGRTYLVSLDGKVNLDGDVKSLPLEVFVDAVQHKRNMLLQERFSDVS